MNDSTAAPIPQCPYCGGIPHQHVGQCPSVKAIEYHEDGSIKRVEKWSPAPWPYGDYYPPVTVA